MVHITRNISLQGSDKEQKRAQIKEYFNKTYESYEALFEMMKCDESYYERPDRLRHPLIFYYGHTAVFYINKLILSKALQNRIDPKLESIFAVGVDEMSWDDLDSKNYDWPSVSQTQQYRDEVKKCVNNFIDTVEFDLPISWQNPLWAVMMGIEHERIHLETSSVLIRQLPIEFVRQSAQFPICDIDNEVVENELLPVSAGRVVLGKDMSDDFYGWDNEYGKHEAHIPNFQASKYLVSNAEFLEFVHDGGYEKDHYWSDEGLGWKNYVQSKHPPFWVAHNGGFKLRTMASEITLPLSWPVEVNCHEAQAFCRYKSEKMGVNLRLPSEDEWYRLYDFCALMQESQWGKRAPANINLEHFASSSAVDMFAHGDFYDVVGNVWQWTQTPIYPFEGFKVHPLYDDFTMPTFDNKHNLIKGGSWISTGNEVLKSSRYAFRPHFFQHAGFRYVSSSYQEQIDANIYESDTLVSIYAQMSWGKEHFGVKNFKKVCADLAIKHCSKFEKALDIGCAMGRGSFELAKSFQSVVGIDYTARFIQNTQKIKEQKKFAYSFKGQGELQHFYSFDLKDFGLDDFAHRVEFWQGDACNLKPNFSGYDLVFATNLIDRLYDPKKFIKDIKKRINSGGVLLLASPYSWDEEFTPRTHWLGGFKKDGENFTTFDALVELLEDEFELLYKDDVEFVIQESDRKFQHSISEVTIWQKR